MLFVSYITYSVSIGKRCILGHKYFHNNDSHNSLTSLMPKFRDNICGLYCRRWAWYSKEEFLPF